MKKVKYRFTVLSLTSTYKIYIYPSLQRTRILISPPVNVVCFTITFAYAGGIIRHDSRSYLPGLARHTSVFLELSQPTTDGSLKEQINMPKFWNFWCDSRWIFLPNPSAFGSWTKPAKICEKIIRKDAVIDYWMAISTKCDWNQEVPRYMLVSRKFQLSRKTHLVIKLIALMCTIFLASAIRD